MRLLIGTMIAQAPQSPTGAVSSRFHAPGWLVYVLALAAATVVVFLAVLDGESTAVFVLFMGLMMIHHLPGFGHHGRAAHSAAAGGGPPTAGAGDAPKDSADEPPCH